MTQGRVLIVAGSDSGGGAGIQADLKAVTALGGYAMTAITALTAQNTEGVHGIHGVPPDFIAQQIAVTADDLGVDAVKTGMLHAVPVIEAVAESLDAHCAGAPVVVDPVMVAKGGHPLLEPDAQSALIELMLPRATVLTPNLPEAEALTGRSIGTVADMETAGRALLEAGPEAVLVKGGHGTGAELTDVLILRDAAAAIHLTGPRIETRHTHGTGCTTASAIAAGLAQGLSVEESVRRARAYVLKAIEGAPGYGRGHGPLDHGHTVTAFAG